MQIHLSDTQVEVAWFLLRQLQCPRNDFKRHIAWTDRLEPEQSATAVGFSAWAGEVDESDLQFLVDLGRQVEKFPGVMVKAFVALEDNLALLQSAAKAEA